MKILTNINRAIREKTTAEGNLDKLSANRLLRVAEEGDQFIYAMLESSEGGLSTVEVTERKKKFGFNEIAHEKAVAWYIQLFQAFLNPFIGVLIVLAAVSFIIDVLIAAPDERSYKTVIVVGVMVMLSSLLRFWQEYSSNRAAESLKSMVKTTATVLRK